jgi:sporulation protein YlmC with PRC-barrel domain
MHDDVRLAPAPGLSCAKLAGDVVVNRESDELGRVRHVLIDVASGRVAYAILGVGGVFGIGEDLLPIPWEAFSHEARDALLVLDIAREELARAPRLDGRQWPAMADPAWLDEICRYYGVRAAAPSR